jgi:hypothetical protein
MVSASRLPANVDNTPALDRCPSARSRIPVVATTAYSGQEIVKIIGFSRDDHVNIENNDACHDQQCDSQSCFSGTHCPGTLLYMPCSRGSAEDCLITSNESCHCRGNPWFPFCAFSQPSFLSASWPVFSCLPCCFCVLSSCCHAPEL